MRSKFVVLSLIAHLSIFFALETAALKPEKPKYKNVEMAIVKNEPPPPPPPPEPPKKKAVDLTKKVEVVKQVVDKPPPPPSAEPPPPPVFGVSLSSTTNAPGGMNVRVGNTTMTDPGKFVDPKDVKPLQGAPVSVAQVTKKPTVSGSCPPFDPGRLYTQAAKDQEIEGRVELEVTIGEDGSPREVRVKKGIGYGLDEAAVAMMKQHCKFEPAEVNGEKVATKINYTVTFALPD